MFRFHGALIDILLWILSHPDVICAPSESQGGKQQNRRLFGHISPKFS